MKQTFQFEPKKSVVTYLRNLIYQTWTKLLGPSLTPSRTSVHLPLRASWVPSKLVYLSIGPQVKGTRSWAVANPTTTFQRLVFIWAVALYEILWVISKPKVDKTYCDTTRDCINSNIWCSRTLWNCFSNSESLKSIKVRFKLILNTFGSLKSVLK